jgi:GAF domain-containing protein
VLLPADEGGLEIAAVASEGPATMLGAVVPPESEIVAELLDGQAAFVDDAATDPRIAAGLARDFGPAMMLPLQSDGRVLGCLVTPRARGERPFTQTERAELPSGLGTRVLREINTAALPLGFKPSHRFVGPAYG